jgi:AbrB family looped-hinge helix DNA binding protein
MRVALDAAGRLVVPKSLRRALGLKPGQALEIRAGDGRLEIEIAPTPMRLACGGDNRRYERGGLRARLRVALGSTADGRSRAWRPSI